LLGDRGRGLGQDRARRVLGVDRIALAEMAPFGAWSARDLDHFDGGALQEPGDAGAVAAGALHAGSRDQPEGAGPAQQLLIAVSGSRQAGRCQHAAELV
jgi:hypothetical protein